MFESGFRFDRLIKSHRSITSSCRVQVLVARKNNSCPNVCSVIVSNANT